MNRVDRIIERMSRRTARSLSRRGFLARIGNIALGSAMAAAPLLPVSRAFGEQPPIPQQPTEAGDPKTCEYWRYCAIDGFLCACCGGSASSCPPGTEPSPITWVGTCRNAADGKNYVISYNDCCGKGACGRCTCTRNENDTPVYQPSTSNDMNWCLGTQSGAVYNCSTAVVLGPAD